MARPASDRGLASGINVCTKTVPGQQFRSSAGGSPLCFCQLQGMSGSSGAGAHRFHESESRELLAEGTDHVRARGCDLDVTVFFERA